MQNHTGGSCGAIRCRGQSGLTLIELMVVILVVGILAGIGAPAFLNQKGKGSDAEAKSTAVAATQAMESCGTANGGAYSSCSKNALLAAEPSLQGAGERLIVEAGIGSFQIVVESKRDAKVSFTVSRASNGRVSRTCVTRDTDRGGCVIPTVGTW